MSSPTALERALHAALQKCCTAAFRSPCRPAGVPLLPHRAPHVTLSSPPRRHPRRPRRPSSPSSFIPSSFDSLFLLWTSSAWSSGSRQTSREAAMAPALCFTPSAGTGLRGSAALAGSSARARPLLRVRWCVPLFCVLCQFCLFCLLCTLRGERPWRESVSARLWRMVSAFIAQLPPGSIHWRGFCPSRVDVGRVMWWLLCVFLAFVQRMGYDPAHVGKVSAIRRVLAILSYRPRMAGMFDSGVADAVR